MWKLLIGVLAAFTLWGPTIANGRTADLPQIEILPITFDPSGLSGAGGERLKSDLRDAQLVALGEDHGFADSPLLARALTTEMRKLGHPIFHAAEIGPFTASWLRQQFGDTRTSDGLKAVSTAIKGKGLAMPFTSNVEDAMLAADFFDKRGKSRLWGIDQEFVGAPLILLDGLLAATSNRATQKALEEIRDADQAALGKFAFDDAWLSKAQHDDFESLAHGFSDNGDALQLLEALSESAEIYQLNNKGAYQASNEYRSALMQGYFLKQYRAAGHAPRVLFKMGAYHLGRGTTPVGIYDLGSLLPGLAAANGLKSLHIAFIPMGGVVRSISPSESGVTAAKAYQDEGIGTLLAAAGIKAESIPQTGHVLIPLANIRYRMTGKQKRDLPELARFTLTGFDYLVTTRDARAATHFEVWVPDIK